MAVLHDIGGVGVGSDTFQKEFSYISGPGKKIQVSTVHYIDTVRLQTLLILAFLQGRMTASLISRPEVIHHSDLDETNAKHPILHSSTRINCPFLDRCDFHILEVVCTGAITLYYYDYRPLFFFHK